MTQKRNLKPLLIVLVLSLGLFAGLAAIRQRIIRPKATGGPILLSFDATPLPLASNQNFTLKIQANPNNTSFNAFEFRFTLPASVEFQDLNNIPANFTKKYSSLLGLETNIAGSKVIVTGAKTNVGFGGSEPIDLIEVLLKVKPDQTGQATFLWDPATEVEGKPYSTTDGQFAIGMVNGARLYFSSAQTSYAKGEDLSLKLHLDTNGRAVSSLDFKLNYDGSALEFQVAGADDSELAANNIDVSDDSGFDTVNTLNMIDSQNKLVRVGLITDTDEPGIGATGDRELATILFKVKEITDVSSLTFTALQDSIVYDLNTQNILTDRPAHNLTINLITPTPIPTDFIELDPTETPTPSVTPTPSITAVPTATLTPSPTTIPTCFDIWKAVFAGTGNGDADFNNDGKVDLVDFEMCRRGEASI